MNNKIESLDIYQTINSRLMYTKYLQNTGGNITECLNNALAVLYSKNFIIRTGSTAEGTAITPEDYGKYLHSMTPCYISDQDIMHVLQYEMWVIDEGDTLPERFDHYLYFLAERGEHTTDGYRKLRSIHVPGYLSGRSARNIYSSIEHGYISCSKILSAALKILPVKHSLKTGFGTQGPSHIIEWDGFPTDAVICFYVKTWPKEAESWFTRETHWPDRKIKSKIRNIGYLLVPTGNSNSQESDIEWRCSFSLAEKILFQSLANFQRCTFVMLKALLKEYLPSDINTNGEKQLLSTYHIKTLFLWSLEDSQMKWEPEDMLGNIDHMFDLLLRWINQQYFPHYFVPSVNLLDDKQLHSRGKSLICCISDIRNNLLKKIHQSQFFMGQEINHMVNEGLLYTYMHHYVFVYITGHVQIIMHLALLANMHIFRQLNLNMHSKLIEGLISIKPDIDPQLLHLYTAMNSDPIQDKVLKETVPGLIDQYRGCLHLAKYCMAARDGQVLPSMLRKAESLLKDTLHLDPCSGYVKLACLYMATGDFIKAMGPLHAAEKNFQCLFIDKDMKTPTLRSIQEQPHRLGTAISQIFQKWTEGQVPSDIVVTWLEYITVPALLQFELIHESTQYLIDVQHGGLKIVGLDCRLQCPPLSFIKLLMFVCTFYSVPPSLRHLDNSVADLIASSLSRTALPGFNEIDKVFNMAAWCYVKVKKNMHAIHMMTVAIVRSSETEIMKSCAFSYKFLAYVIEQCLAKGSRDTGQI